MLQTQARITEGPIDEAAVRRAVEAPESGALVLFAGVVRNHDDNRDVLSLDYQAHPDAEAIMAETVRGVMESSGLKIAAAHRVGELAIGDVALYAAVAAAHRKEAFEACELVVEMIKRSVPIWKRQHFVSGVSEWVGL